MRCRRCPGFISRLNLQGLVSDLCLAPQKVGNLLAAFLLRFVARCPCHGQLLFGTFFGEVMACGKATTRQMQNKSHKHPDFLSCWAEDLLWLYELA